MLKPLVNVEKSFAVLQPPSGGCVLKLRIRHTSNSADSQPPSGGCVLKHFGDTVKI